MAMADPSKREWDIVVFGATGFTGRCVAQEVIRAGFRGSVALAGRDRARLEALSASLFLPSLLGTMQLPSMPPGRHGIIVADVGDAASLAAMASSARIVLNAVGPFRLFGEAVVEACVNSGTDYLDVSGEPEFIERMELKYGRAARAAGCYVASAAGFDSVPCDVGAHWTAQQLPPPARCTLVEAYIAIHAGPSGFRGHFPTYESAVYGVASAGELSALRRRAAAEHGRAELGVPGPRARRRTGPHWEPRVGAYAVPFMGSDASVVRRTAASMAAAGQQPYNCSVYLTLPNRLALFLYLVFGTAFTFLARRGWGRRLLLAFPRLFSCGVFSREGPSARQLAETTFTMRMFASGYSHGAPPPAEPLAPPDVAVETRVAGPEPGYVSCSIFLVAAGMTLLEERGRLGVDPGVHTPAWLLHNTDYVKRLRTCGISLDLIAAPSKSVEHTRTQPTWSTREY